MSLFTQFLICAKAYHVKYKVLNCGLYVGIYRIDVLNFLGSKWIDLSLYLGLEKYNQMKTRKCIRDMLAAWLSQKDNLCNKGLPSWQVLKDALVLTSVENCVGYINRMLFSTALDSVIYIS